MKGLYTGLAIWNAAAQGAFCGLAIASAQTEVVSPRAFQLLALFAGVFCLLVQSLLIVHFIGSMKWIQQSGPTAGLDDTKELRRAWIRGPMFPLLIASMLAAVATGILAGAGQRQDVHPAIGIALAALCTALCVLAIPLARRGIDAARARMTGLRRQMEERTTAGLVQDAEAASLLPESGQAGGKTLVFLGINAWLAYAYARFVLRHPHEPLWPYALASALLIGLGAWMWFRWRRHGNDTGAAP